LWIAAAEKIPALEALMPVQNRLPAALWVKRSCTTADAAHAPALNPIIRPQRGLPRASASSGFSSRAPLRTATAVLWTSQKLAVHAAAKVTRRSHLPRDPSPAHAVDDSRNTSDTAIARTIPPNTGPWRGRRYLVKG
jgi:hypothetical protein